MLSTVLLVLLILAIVFMSMLIRLVQTLRKVADKAEHLVESAETVGTIIKNVAAPATALRFLHVLFDMANRKKKDK